MKIIVNGIELFYEEIGNGNPILLLHGNGENRTIFDILINQLSKHYTVYAIDSRDHGESSKVNELNYNMMMEDMVTFIRLKKLEKPIVYGFSDGGIIALLMASKYPDLLSKLIISGANITPNGLKFRSVLSMHIEYLLHKDKKIRMMLKEPHITVSDLKRIIVPTLVLAGSDDLIKRNHTKKIARHIPNSILRIIEGENHGSYVIHSNKLFDIIAPFLEIEA